MSKAPSFRSVEIDTAQTIQPLIEKASKKQRTGDYKRLNMDIPVELHREVKRRAMDADVTITDWVEQAIKERLSK